MSKIKKLGKQLSYNRGVFNNKNELVLAQALQLAMDKIDELVGEFNRLNKPLKQQDNETDNTGD